MGEKSSRIEVKWRSVREGPDAEHFPVCLVIDARYLHRRSSACLFLHRPLPLPLQPTTVNYRCTRATAAGSVPITASSLQPRSSFSYGASKTAYFNDSNLTGVCLFKTALSPTDDSRVRATLINREGIERKEERLRNEIVTSRRDTSIRFCENSRRDGIFIVNSVGTERAIGSL